MTTRTPERRWRRFTAYQIKDGCIRPRPGSRLQAYDPWAAYRGGRSKGDEPPYQALLALLDRIVVGDGEVRLNDVARTAIVDWCNRFGLLGILPHRALMIVVAPSMVPDSAIDQLAQPPGVERVDVKSLKVPAIPKDYPPFDPTDMEDPQPYTAASSFHVRDGDRWRIVTTTWPNAPSEETEEDLAGHVVSPDRAPVGWAKAVMTHLTDGTIQEVSLRDGIGRFFPNVPDCEKDTHNYPVPLTERFWQEYAEPLDDFLETALAFRNAAAGMATVKSRGLGVRVTAPVRQKISKALRTLHSLTGPVRPVLAIRNGTLQNQWATASLLSTFALMLQQDVEAGWRVVKCRECGEVFTAHDSRLSFCTEQCRWRFNKRNARTKSSSRHVGRQPSTKRR